MINYSNFKKNNIDIYNPEDDAFKKICYSNTKLKEDYPFNYRKTKIYSQKKFEGVNNVCSYKEIDVENKMVIMKCKYSENGFGYKYTDNKLKEEKTNNVPLKCFSSLFKKLNVGVIIIGLLLLSMFFFIIIFKCCCKEKEDIETPNNNKETIDEIKNESENNKQIFSPQKDEDIEKGKKKYKNNNNDEIDTNQGLNNDNTNNNKISFSSILYQTFLKSHPLLSICNRKPKVMSYLFFAFTIINYFTFNIIFYNDSLIEKNINNKDKNSLTYPINKQKSKIISSIIVSMLLTFILKLFGMTCYGSKLKDGNGRKNLSKVLIIFITIFFLFYSSIFCYLYPNTEKSWVSSGILCIVIDWVILSPILIFILSILDFKGLKLPYNIRELF